MTGQARRPDEPQCLVRVGEPCRLCHPGATGPHDCGLAWLVTDDEELRALVLAGRRAAARLPQPA